MYVHDRPANVTFMHVDRDHERPATVTFVHVDREHLSKSVPDYPVLFFNELVVVNA